MLNCKEAAMLMSQSMDKKLGVLDGINLRFHLMRCDGCKNFSMQMQFLRLSCQKLTQHNPDINE